MTIIGGQGNFAFLADRTSWATTIFGALVGTLCAYVFVVTAGMSTVFTCDMVGLVDLFQQGVQKVGLPGLADPETLSWGMARPLLLVAD